MRPVVPARNHNSGNSDNFDVNELKRRISPRLLRVPGVSGVGIREGILTVYLAVDSEEVRQDVAAILESESAGALVNYVVTGAFRAR